MLTNTGVGIKLIEQEANYEADSLARIKHMPAYWLDSSKSRMFQQAALGKERDGHANRGSRRCIIHVH